MVKTRERIKARQQETFVAYTKGIANGTVANVQNFVRAAVLAEAEASIPVIGVTPVE